MGEGQDKDLALTQKIWRCSSVQSTQTGTQQDLLASQTDIVRKQQLSAENSFLMIAPATDLASTAIVRALHFFRYGRLIAPFPQPLHIKGEQIGKPKWGSSVE